MSNRINSWQSSQTLVEEPLLTKPVVQEAVVAGKTILAKAKEEAGVEEDLVQKTTGLTLARTWFASGTKMLDFGERRAVQYRKEWEAEPVLDDSMDSIGEIVSGENRVDYTVPFKDVQVGSNGVMTGVNGNIILNENAWSQIVSKGPENLGRLRGNLNLWTPHSAKAGNFRTRKANPETGVSECYAVVGKRYQRFDFDEVASLIKATMPKDAHATFLYDGFKWQIEVSFAAPVDVGSGTLGVGRLHRIAAVFSGADDGTQSIRQKYKAVRIVCINCTVVDSEKLVFTRKHVGQTMGQFLEQAMGHASEALEVFGARWRQANEASIVDAIDGGALEPGEIFRRLIAHGFVKAPGAGGNVNLQDLLMASFSKEPGNTAAHVNMAITRMAHEQARKWTSPWVMDEIEEQAGQLLFQEVYGLQRLSKEQEEAWAA